MHHWFSDSLHHRFTYIYVKREIIVTSMRPRVASQQYLLFRVCSLDLIHFQYTEKIWTSQMNSDEICTVIGLWIENETDGCILKCFCRSVMSLFYDTSGNYFTQFGKTERKGWSRLTLYDVKIAGTLCYFIFYKYIWLKKSCWKCEIQDV